MKALLVVDLENYFINKYTNFLPREIFNHIKNNSYNFVLFSRFVNNTSTTFYKTFNWIDCCGGLETEINEIFDDFIKDNNVFIKSSYSIFKNTDFLNYLIEYNIKEIDICGIDTDACVLASAFDGFDLGYNVKVLTNLCYSSGGDEYHESGLNIINRNINFNNNI